MINQRLKAFLEKNRKMLPFQAGFRPGRHDQDAFWRLVEEVTCAFRSKKQVQAVFLDIKAAYDFF